MRTKYFSGLLHNRRIKTFTPQDFLTHIAERNLLAHLLEIGEIWNWISVDGFFLRGVRNASTGSASFPFCLAALSLQTRATHKSTSTQQLQLFLIDRLLQQDYLTFQSLHLIHSLLPSMPTTTTSTSTCSFGFGRSACVGVPII